MINGLTLGLLFALIALGFTLIVGVMEVINLAHGSLFALGAYSPLSIIAPDFIEGTAVGAWWFGLPIAARYTAGGGGQLTHCTLTDNAEGIVVVEGPGPQIRPAGGEE